MKDRKKVHRVVVAVSPEMEAAIKSGMPVSVGYTKASPKCVAQESCHALENGYTHEPRPVAGPDNEAHVRNRILTAMRMALSLRDSMEVRADKSAFEHGLRGIAEGTSVEVLGTLGFDLHQLVNLRRIHGPDILC